NIQDERELRTQLAVLLDGTEPQSAPVAATVRRGRTIRVRRRITAVAGVAVAVAAAIVLPSVLSAPPRSAVPEAPAHYKVTVDRLDPVAHGGVIARGVTDGKSWKVVVSGSPGSPDVHFEEAASGASGSRIDMGSGPVRTASPVSVFETQTGASFTEMVGTVSPDVTNVVMRLPDGERPDAIPVSWGGHYWFALVLPAGVPIVRAIAYAGARELAYAVPFQGSELNVWWPPGRVGPARATRSIGSGVVAGKSWRATAWIGPWGWCYGFGTGDSACLGSTAGPQLQGKLISPISCEATDPALGIAVAAPAVRRVTLRFSNRTSASFAVVAVAGTRTFGYAIPAHAHVTSSNVYGPNGRLLGSVPADMWGC
ncbi:MAG: hypothetical protein J2P29_13705, partial [Actinobacteria bacterium]|nr:hypothetical protein [Actinomycetota bacterium]